MPLRRTPFRRRPIRKEGPTAPREVKPWAAALAAATLRPVSVGTYGTNDSTAAVIQKFVYIRSPALLKACREIPCQYCGRADGTVVAAHSNQAQHGKGRGIKASDQFIAALCAWCHAALDQGNAMSRTERIALWTKAHIKTVTELMRRGLWPAGVPVPLPQLETTP